MCETSKPYLVPVPNYWALTKNITQKSRFFWSNPYKTSLIENIEMLDLPNFVHMTTSTMSFESRDKILLVTLGTEIMTLER